MLRSKINYSAGYMVSSRGERRNAWNFEEDLESVLVVVELSVMSLLGGQIFAYTVTKYTFFSPHILDSIVGRNSQNQRSLPLGLWHALESANT